MQRITHIGVFSLAKIMGLVMLLLSCLFVFVYGAVMLAVFVVGAAAGGAQAPGPVELGAIIGIVLAVPVVYGIIGFVMGALYALALNLVFHLTGGLEVQIRAE